jgi:hypothetical protein
MSDLHLPEDNAQTYLWIITNKNEKAYFYPRNPRAGGLLAPVGYGQMKALMPFLID